MRPLIYKGLRLGTNKTEWVSSDEIKQSYSQIRLLAIQNDNYAWIPIADGTLCRGSEAKDITGKRIYEKDHIEFDCKSVQETPLVAEVYYVEIGHPYYYVPEVDGERVIYDLLDNDLPEEFAECDFVYFKKVKQEHLCELSKELTEVFRKWEKSHGYGYSAYLVKETELYRIGDYIDSNGNYK